MSRRFFVPPFLTCGAVKFKNFAVLYLLFSFYIFQNAPVGIYLLLLLFLFFVDACNVRAENRDAGVCHGRNGREPTVRRGGAESECARERDGDKCTERKRDKYTDRKREKKRGKRSNL